MNSSTANELMAGSSHAIRVDCQVFRCQIAKKARVRLVGPARSDRIFRVVPGMEQRHVANFPGMVPFGNGSGSMRVLSLIVDASDRGACLELPDHGEKVDSRAGRSVIWVGQFDLFPQSGSSVRDCRSAGQAEAVGSGVKFSVKPVDQVRARHDSVNCADLLARSSDIAPRLGVGAAIALSPGAERRERADNLSLARGNDKLRPGDDEHGRAGDRQPQVSKNTRTCQNGFPTLWPCAGRARLV